MHHPTSPLVLALALALPAALPAQGPQLGWRDLVGKKAPAMSVAEWLNTENEEPSSAAIKNKVRLLQFFSLEHDPWIGDTEYLCKLHDTYHDRGLRIFAVAPDSAADLQAKIIDKHQAKYWIGTGPKETLMHNFAEPGKYSLPHYFLIDITGKVISSSGKAPSEQEVLTLLKEIYDVRLGRELHSKLNDAVSSYKYDCYKVAFDQARAMLKEADKDLVADAKFLCSKIEKHAKHQQKELKKEVGDLGSAKAYGMFLLLKYQFGNVDKEIESWTKDNLKKLAKAHSVKKKKENKAWKDFERALQKASKGCKNDKQRLRNISEYEKVRDKHKLTTASWLARKQAEALQDAQ